MDGNAVREALQKKPFVPFTLRLIDGRSVCVPNPDLCAASSGVVIVIDPDDESTAILEPLLIVSVEYPGSTLPSVGLQEKQQ